MSGISNKFENNELSFNFTKVLSIKAFFMFWTGFGASALQVLTTFFDQSEGYILMEISEINHTTIQSSIF